MSKRRFNIMVVPPSTDRVRQYSLPQWIGSAAITAGVIGLVTFLAAVGLAAYGLSRSEQYSNQQAENATLQVSLTKMEADVAVLREQLANLEQMEQSVRLVFGFPEINPDERALGTGGGPLLTHVFSAVSHARTYELEGEIDRLLRRCSFERDNYAEILSGLVDRKDQLDHTPSIYPTNGYLSRGFGIKPDPFTGRKRMHNGIDVAGNAGLPIYAPADGRVTGRRRQKQLGRLIVLDHGFGVETYYGHLSKYAVKLHGQVKRGDVIGYVGNSGYSTAAHLHYEVRVNGRPVNPMKYIYDKAPQPGEPLAFNE